MKTREIDAGRPPENERRSDTLSLLVVTGDVEQCAQSIARKLGIRIETAVALAIRHFAEVVERES